ncbi:hypothetical protein POX_d05836 [Penicillium oxalicum]|uniref:hypothetical protein n=1 Tax=Penicillium oxalicum TaxID=69781 RepID=UPI0020B6CFDA|nr:hypothetical protein POX_d05836 [Penicillium oxalicum]KAI2790326.1 hypothetical protein POX_d05836 [Penicillium oxalicum]
MSDYHQTGFPYAPNILPDEPTTNEQIESTYRFASSIVPSGLSPHTSELLAGRRDSSEFASDLGQGSRNPKVPIPRATRPVAYSTGGRVSRACEACRDQKAKCSGHRPSCHRCQESGMTCSYGDRKREKMLKQLDELTAQLNVYETLVRELYPRLEPVLVQHVDHAIGRQSGMSRPKPFSEGETSNFATSITNCTEEDFNRDEKVRATDLLRHLDNGKSIPGAGDDADQETVSISSLSYFEDGIEILSLDRAELSKRPPSHIADHFVDLYFRHSASDISNHRQGVFLTQYQSFYSDANVRPGKRWIAVLNLVFAIAAAYAPLVDDGFKVDGDNHLSLQQVQVEGLIAFYLFCTGQVNRPDIECGGRSLRLTQGFACEWVAHPIRTAFCTTPLPIPFIEEDFDVTSIIEIVDDMTVRTALVTSLLSPGSDETPNSGTEESSPNPHVPARDYSRKGKKAEKVMADLIGTITPNTSLAFLYGLDLDRLTRDAIEVVISNLNANADAWLSRLPAEFQISKLSGIDSDPFVRQRADIGFRFYNTKIVITQPCLSQLAYQPSSAHARAGGTFCDTMAAVCVRMACEMWDMLPDEPSTTWLFEVSPWWCVLHYFMQSVTVILTQLFYRTQPQTLEAAYLVNYVEKALRWLHAMSDKDPRSKKALLVCMGILSRHGKEFFPKT